MDKQEKFNLCIHRPDEKIEIFEGCPCKKKKKLVSKCTKLNIIDLKPDHCEHCTFFENKNP